jgi:hypothetical protein
VLLVLMGILITLLVTRSNVDATILRTPGMLFQKSEKGNIINLYNISVINKTNEEMPITLKLMAPAQGSIQVVKNNLVLPKQGITEGVFLAEIPPQYLKGINSEIEIEVGVYSNGELIAVEKTKFMGPAK